MRGRALILAVLFAVLFVASLSLSKPQMIHYQGKLTTPDGALIDTIVSIHVCISDIDNTGYPEIIWWEETHDSVKVEKGIFSLLLGSKNTIPDSIFTGDIKYLGIRVGTDPIMMPLKPMTTVPYAYTSISPRGYAWIHDKNKDTYVHAEKNADKDENKIWFATGGVERMIIDDQGRVGIGTTNPDPDFEATIKTTVHGRYSLFLDAEPPAHNTIVWMKDPQEYDPCITEQHRGDFGWGVNQLNADGTMEHRDVLVLSINGNVGIGLGGYFPPAPAAKLEVSVDGETSPDLFMLNSDDNLHGDRFVVKNDGNVGIGMTNPATKLEVAGAITVQERSEPTTPAANSAVLFLVDAGGGKQALKIKFDDGVVKTIAHNQ